MPTPTYPVVNKATTQSVSALATAQPTRDVNNIDPQTGHRASATANRYYYDDTAGQIANTDDVVKSYDFNLPLIKSADRGSLPSDLYPGPTLTNRGYLFQDPNVHINNNSVTGAKLDPETLRPLEAQVEYAKLNQDSKKYGFRFLYNPSSVSMAVGYSEGVDINAIMANLDSMYNPIVPQTGSNIVFELWLNRIEDLALGSKLSTDMYPKGSGANADKIHDILRKGTMADYEYLLLCLNSGKRLQSKYRGNTADIGWLLGGAVVLKLGKSLVYQGFIQSVSINHVRFTPTMVPALSSVQITMARYVDVVPGTSSGSREEITNEATGAPVRGGWAMGSGAYQ